MMISDNLRNKIIMMVSKEGDKLGYWLDRPEYEWGGESGSFVLKIHKAAQIDWEEEKKETFLCKLGLHKWSAWSKPQLHSLVGAMAGYQIQKRKCERCGIVNGRRVVE